MASKAPSNDGRGSDADTTLDPNPPDVSQVGTAIRARRNELGMSLRELGDHVGLSVGFLSQVERGQSSIALGSLVAVARALEVDVSTFFKPAADDHGGVDREVPGGTVHVTRADEPTDFSIDATVRSYRMLAGRYPRTLEPILVTVHPAETRQEVLRAERGEKFIYVLEGELVYIVDGQEYTLRAGDSIHHPATVPHALENSTSAPVKALWVLTPPIL